MGWSAGSREENGDDEELSEGAVGAAFDIASGEPQHEFGGGLGNGLKRWGLLEEFASVREFHASTAIGEQAEVSDAHEPGGKDVEEETADELVAGQGHGFDAISVSVITPTETDLALGELDEAVVGECDAVGITPEVGDDLLRSGEGTLGVDDTIVRTQRSEEDGEVLRGSELGG